MKLIPHPVSSELDKIIYVCARCGLIDCVEGPLTFDEAAKVMNGRGWERDFLSGETMNFCGSCLEWLNKQEAKIRNEGC